MSIGETGRLKRLRFGRSAGRAIGTLLLLAAGAASGLPAEAAVVGEIVQVGFRDRFGSCYRRGRWCPVRVQLALRGQSEFTGMLHAAQPDVDADRCYVEVPVNLSGDGSRRTYNLYVLPNTPERGEIAVRLLDEDGAAVMIERPDGTPTLRLLEQAIAPVVDEALLIVDVSAQPVSRLAGAIERTYEQFNTTVHYASLGAELLPPDWFGLEAVDVIVWDAPDPGALEARQLDALLEWVRSGGQLVLAAGRTAGAVAQSKLGPLLPVEIGELRAVETLPEVQRQLLLLDDSASWPSPISYCRTSLRAGTGARAIIQADEGGQSPFVSCVPLGTGQIKFVAAELRDLWRAGPREQNDARAAQRDSFVLGHLLPLRVNNYRGDEQTRLRPSVDLFGHVRGTVDFRARGGAFMIIALLFISAYILIATLVAWNWLNRRGWRQHNWAAFAILVGAASLVSVLAVRVVQGVGRDLHQLTVVDTRPGTTAARASACFGLKTASHTSLDLWLPNTPDLPDIDDTDRCMLRPMPPGGGPRRTGFLSPTTYRARPVRAVLENVLFRATLKQFQGCWNGELPGKLSAEIIERGNLIDDRSWVHNELGMDLEGCYLITARMDPARARSPASLNVHWLGALPNGTRLDRLGSVIEQRNPRRPSPDEERVEERDTLATMHPQWIQELEPSWAPTFGGEDRRQIDPESYDKALLLLTTLGDFQPDPAAGGSARDAQLVPTNLRQLDGAEMLTRNMALFVGFAGDEGPVRLCVRPGGRAAGRFTPLVPKVARTMYRVWIPLGW